VNRPPARPDRPAAGTAARPDRPAAGTAAHRERTGAGGWLAYLVVLGFVAADLVWLWAGGAHAAKGGTLALAGAMFVAALARLVLPESRAGLLASRKRITDVVTMAALGTGLLAAVLLSPVPL
jgi:Protein of unknown function (DUF3017)